MAVEEKRGCGYRKVGGIYLEGGCEGIGCDRLPFMLETCPVCGGGVKLGRGYTKINPLRLFDLHDNYTEGSDGRRVIYEAICQDPVRPCVLCDPPDEVAFIMLVGEKFYSPASFLAEASRMGVSKRVAFIPRELVVGRTVIYLAHLQASELKEKPADQQEMPMSENESQPPRLLDTERVKRVPGIFTAFIPHRIVQMVWESQLRGEEGEKFRTSLAKRGITPITVKDGDRDHAPNGSGDD